MCINRIQSLIRTIHTLFNLTMIINLMLRTHTHTHTHTQVVYLASESFHYRFGDRWKIGLRRFATEQWPDTIGRKVSNDLPLKVGGL